MKRDMRHLFQGGGVLAVGLLVACASGPRELRDEGSERIEEAMRPEPHPDVLPAGIFLGDDAPPLAIPEPEVASAEGDTPSNAGPPQPGWFYGTVPVIVPGPVFGPYPGAIRYHIEPKPGGSIPGLLP
jgi:uncharacterized lipoprotein